MKKKRTENYKSNQKANNKMGISTYLSIITLNVNGLNAQIKDIGIGFKKDPSICCLQETHFRAKDTD